MDTQPFRFDVRDAAGNKIGFVVWSGVPGLWRAYRSAGQKPIGKGETLNEARAVLFAYVKSMGARQ